MYVNKELLSLSQLTFFNGIEADNLEKIKALSVTKQIPKYSYIYRAEQSSDFIFFLAEGRVKLCTYSEEGKELIKKILYPGEMFGESSVMHMEDHSDFAQTMDQMVTVYAIEVDVFKEFLIKNPNLNIRFTEQLTSRLKEAEARIEAFIFKNARTRIVDYMKSVADNRGIAIGSEVLIKKFLTHNEIASLIGTSRQTVTMVLNDLKKANQIHIDRRNVLIRDIATLA